MKAVRVLLVVAAVGGAFWSGYVYRSSRGGAPAAGGRKILYYVDPMHPAYKSDKPGIAPDCGMKLEPVYADGPAAAPAAERKILHYRDPADPKYQADKPGLNPETGNVLEPVYAGDAASMLPGAVQISPEKQQLIGVRYGVAEVTGGTETLRVTGKVTFDERRVDHVHTKIEGWIDKVFVDFTGQLVKMGQPLLTIYSPELLASQRELLLAERSRQTMRRSTLPAAVDQSETLLQATRQRLQLWDVSEAQIEEVLRTGKPFKNVTLYAPMGGFVLERKAFPGQKIMPDSDLYTLVDLSKVWVMADVFEQESGRVHLGQSATIELPYAGGRRIAARVSYIQPQMDAMTRSLKVRLEMDNPDLALKPEMFVNVEFRVPLQAAVTVPSEAVLDSGDRKTVFVDRGNGFLEPRRVETGERKGDRIAIVSGVKAGERVVTSGNFLIDSESQLKAAAEGMGSGAAPQPAETPSAPPPPGHQHD